jgi:hypothetical protein
MNIFEFQEGLCGIYFALSENSVCFKFQEIRIVVQREETDFDFMMTLQNLMGLDSVIRNIWLRSAEFTLILVSLLKISFSTIIL